MNPYSKVARALALVAYVQCAPTLADVTIQEQTTIHASIMKLHATSLKQIAGEKQRSEMQMSCEGMMSMLCGRNKTLEIVRLDRDLTWNMQPKDRHYTEITLPTPEEQHALLARQQAAIDKLKSCPRAQPTERSVDTSKCEMSAPVLTVNKSDEVASFIGKAATKTNVSMTQNCKIKDSGDVCQMIYSMDVWLTQEELPGIADRTSFQRSYQRRLGLDSTASLNVTQLNAMLAPYADSLKQLSAKSADLKGYPLKTSFRFAVSGAHCALAPTSGNAGDGGTLTAAGRAAGQATASSTEHAAGWGTSEAVQRAAGSGVGSYVAGSAAGAFTQSLVGGLFAKKKAAEQTPSAAPASGSTATSVNAPSTTVVEVDVETTAIDAAPISGKQFEIPDGWKKVDPKAAADTGLPTCP